MKKISDEEKRRRGTFKPCMENTNQPIYDDIDLSPPTNLTKGAKKYWNNITPALKESGVAKNTDAYAIADLCKWLDVSDSAYKKYQKEGAVLDIGDYPMVNPQYTIFKQAQTEVNKLVNSLGLNPVTRSKLIVAKPPEENTLKTLMDS
jgi:P27 family predicted phage terminase small subunit